MDQDSKAAWSKPVLIRLTRGSDEECVLSACKLTTQMGRPTGPGATYGACLGTFVTCDACDSLAVS